MVVVVVAISFTTLSLEMFKSFFPQSPDISTEAGEIITAGSFGLIMNFLGLQEEHNPDGSSVEFSLHFLQHTRGGGWIVVVLQAIYDPPLAGKPTLQLTLRNQTAYDGL
jgi:hypothetical protein